ncbi:DUF2637 domain-containing protein [Amycolatopsis sp. DSM 110486]|uniref:DUF2637 domain-containing protein n=1 Tax=Amycolatopsis sp. DSM 110486 TaxID=2865832 RepID=UPI001C6A14C9|nr:DUF2637 domain-containing protein [Amycolatopsis sp. DSM 110486]QYN20412.1 DUF2637 domain-containing protein [Amycolatopsis sp. DSM 110486]
MVALGAAYASYRHGRGFALRFGADGVTASIWPLLVDGLLTIATVELWKSHHGARPEGRRVAWLAFVFGICLSLVANIGSAPMLRALQVTVAACPPLVLLLAVELLNGALKRRTAVETGSETASARRERSERCLDDESGHETAEIVGLHSVSHPSTAGGMTAEQRMWEHYLREAAGGRTPNGAELDRVAGTHNYGRRVLRQWRAAKKIPRSPRSEVSVASVD